MCGICIEDTSIEDVSWGKNERGERERGGSESERGIERAREGEKKRRIERE